MDITKFIEETNLKSALEKAIVLHYSQVIPGEYLHDLCWYPLIGNIMIAFNGRYTQLQDLNKHLFSTMCVGENAGVAFKADASQMDSQVLTTPLGKNIAAYYSRLHEPLMYHIEGNTLGRDVSDMVGDYSSMTRKISSNVDSLSAYDMFTCTVSAVLRLNDSLHFMPGGHNDHIHEVYRSSIFVQVNVNPRGFSRPLRHAIKELSRQLKPARPNHDSFTPTKEEVSEFLDCAMSLLMSYYDISTGPSPALFSGPMRLGQTNWRLSVSRMASDKPELRAYCQTTEVFSAKSINNIRFKTDSSRSRGEWFTITMKDGSPLIDNREGAGPRDPEVIFKRTTDELEEVQMRIAVSLASIYCRTAQMKEWGVFK